jgi:hypothetical protein
MSNATYSQSLNSEHDNRAELLAQRRDGRQHLAHTNVFGAAYARGITVPLTTIFMEPPLFQARAPEEKPGDGERGPTQGHEGEDGER